MHTKLTFYTCVSNNVIFSQYSIKHDPKNSNKFLISFCFILKKHYVKIAVDRILPNMHHDRYCIFYFKNQINYKSFSHNSGAKNK